MLKLQKSSLILILIIVVLTAGCVSIYTLGYTPGTVWHKAEDVKSGTFGQNVGGSNYNFPGKVGIKKTNPSSELDVTGDIYATGQVIAGTMFKVGATEFTSNSGKIGGNLTVTGNVGIGTTSPGAKLDVAGQIKITGGTPGAGKVLTSDDTGLATWQTPSASMTQGQLMGWCEWWPTYDGQCAGALWPAMCVATEDLHYCKCADGFTVVDFNVADGPYHYSCYKN